MMCRRPSHSLCFGFICLPTHPLLPTLLNVPGQFCYYSPLQLLIVNTAGNLTYNPSPLSLQVNIKMSPLAPENRKYSLHLAYFTKGRELYLYFGNVWRLYKVTNVIDTYM